LRQIDTPFGLHPGRRAAFGSSPFDPTGCWLHSIFQTFFSITSHNLYGVFCFWGIENPSTRVK
jgi:hypothetical protein